MATTRQEIIIQNQLSENIAKSIQSLTNQNVGNEIAQVEESVASLKMSMELLNNEVNVQLLFSLVIYEKCLQLSGQCGELKEIMVSAGRVASEKQVLLSYCQALQVELNELSSARENLIHRNEDTSSKILACESSLTQLKSSVEVRIL